MINNTLYCKIYRYFEYSKIVLLCEIVQYLKIWAFGPIFYQRNWFPIVGGPSVQHIETGAGNGQQATGSGKVEQLQM